MISEAELRESYPTIEWDEPIRVTITGGEGTSFYAFCCRYCIAQKGLKASDVTIGKEGWESPQEAQAHIERAHG